MFDHHIFESRSTSHPADWKSCSILGFLFPVSRHRLRTSEQTLYLPLTLGWKSGANESRLLFGYTGRSQLWLFRHWHLYSTSVHVITCMCMWYAYTCMYAHNIYHERFYPFCGNRADKQKLLTSPRWWNSWHLRASILRKCPMSCGTSMRMTSSSTVTSRTWPSWMCSWSPMRHLPKKSFLDWAGTGTFRSDQCVTYFLQAGHEGWWFWLHHGWHGQSCCSRCYPSPCMNANSVRSTARKTCLHTHHQTLVRLFPNVSCLLGKEPCPLQYVACGVRIVKSHLVQYIARTPPAYELEHESGPVPLQLAGLYSCACQCHGPHFPPLRVAKSITHFLGKFEDFF